MAFHEDYFVMILLVFCRILIGVVFSISFFTKIGNISAFQTSVADFQLLSKKLIEKVTLLFLLGEFIVMTCMVIGSYLLSIGFLLAIFLLVIFSIALLTVLLRNIQTSCNCFGKKSKIVSYYDIVRNIGFIIFAIIGWIILYTSNTISVGLSLPELGLITFVALAFIVIWTNLSDIVNIFSLH